MYEWGIPPPELVEQLSPDYVLQVGDTVYVEREDECEFPWIPFEKFEVDYGNALWNKIRNEGQTPLYVFADIVNVVVPPYTPGPYPVVIVRTKYAVRIEQTLTLASLVIDWGLIILLAFVLAIITSPYWGPLFWRVAGYPPGVAPPAPQVFDWTTLAALGIFGGLVLVGIYMLSG